MVVTRLGRWLIALITVPVAITVIIGVGGYLLFTRATVDPISSADAIIVLGGEHDGREDYALQLARSGVSNTVVMSNPYNARDARMRAYCAAGTAAVRVLCVKPTPSTTRGEAIFTERLAQQYGWNHVIVISWRYHLPRARFIFSQCFHGTVTMATPPRAYPLSLADWEYVYLYQLSGFAKAALQGSDCRA